MGGRGFRRISCIIIRFEPVEEGDGASKPTPDPSKTRHIDIATIHETDGNYGAYVNHAASDDADYGSLLAIVVFSGLEIRYCMILVKVWIDSAPCPMM